MLGGRLIISHGSAIPRIPTELRQMTGAQAAGGKGALRAPHHRDRPFHAIVITHSTAS
jgi:hypothetical protein